MQTANVDDTTVVCKWPMKIAHWYTSLNLSLSLSYRRRRIEEEKNNNGKIWGWEKSRNDNNNGTFYKHEVGISK